MATAVLRWCRAHNSRDGAARSGALEALACPTRPPRLRPRGRCTPRRRRWTPRPCSGPPPALPGRPARPALVPPAKVPHAQRRSPPTAAPRCCTRSRTSSSTPSTWRSTPSGASPACPTPSTATGCAWRARRRCTSRCCASTCTRWAIDYGDFDAHDGLWEMAERTAARPDWRAWRWCRARWKRAGWTPRRRSRPSCARPAMRVRWRSSTSSCATRSAMSPSATAGTAGCASATASTRWRTYAQLAARHGAPRLRGPVQPATRGAPPASTKPNSPRSPPAIDPHRT